MNVRAPGVIVKGFCYWSFVGMSGAVGIVSIEVDIEAGLNLNFESIELR